MHQTDTLPDYEYLLPRIPTVAFPSPGSMASPLSLERCRLIYRLLRAHTETKQK